MEDISFQKEDVLALADASNELCVAIETMKISQPDIFSNYVGNILMQDKDRVWAILEKFGF